MPLMIILIKQFHFLIMINSRKSTTY